MIAVIFEVYQKEDGCDVYLQLVGELREQFKNIPGLLSVERL